MAQLQRGVPFIDLLVPEGTAAQVAELQTRLDLVTGGGWRIQADDGTFEDSSLPSQPLRGRLDRIWVSGSQPLGSPEELQVAASLAVELTLLSQARMAAVGVWGLFAWSFVLFEDLRWLHGLLLLDWLYNPRVSAQGEIVEDPDPADDGQTVTEKLAVFQALWTPEGAAELGKALPPGVLQPVETHTALSLMGQDGGFDPRTWQSLSMQLILPQVRAFAAAAGDTPPTPVPLVAEVPSEPAPPSDGLTPLARAQRDAKERARLQAERGPVEEPEPEIDGDAVAWREGLGGPVLWLPADRYDPAALRQLRAGSVDGLARGERPSGEVLDRWLGSGAPFVSEVPFLSRLFVDDKPLNKGSVERLTEGQGDPPSLLCHLPRVARVRAVILPTGGAGRRILVASDTALDAAQIVALAGV